jgi:superfamily II DNA or RNA helicase
VLAENAAATELQPRHKAVYQAIDERVFVRSHPTAHLKAYIINEHLIAGSGNLTENGLEHALEMIPVFEPEDTTDWDLEGLFYAYWTDDETHQFEHVLKAVCEFAPFGRQIVDVPVSDSGVLRRAYGITSPDLRQTLAEQSWLKQLVTLDEQLARGRQSGPMTDCDPRNAPSDEEVPDDVPDALEAYFADLYQHAAVQRPNVDPAVAAQIRHHCQQGQADVWEQFQQLDIDWTPTVDPIHQLWTLDFVAEFGEDALDLLAQVETDVPPSFPVMKAGLRPYQEAALREWLAGGRNGVLEMATATGKTIVAIAAIAELCGYIANFGPPRSQDAEILVLVHRQPLIEQWQEACLKFLGFVDADLTWDDETRSLEFATGRITIQTPQYFDSNPDEITAHSYDLVIYDEVHHYSRPQGWGESLSVLDREATLGLSATLEPPKRQLLERQLGEIEYTYSFERAQADGPLPECAFLVHPIELTDEEQVTYTLKKRQRALKFQEVLQLPETFETIEQLQTRNAPQRHGYFMYDGYVHGDWDSAQDLTPEDLFRWTNMAEFEVGVQPPEEWLEFFWMVCQQRSPIHTAEYAEQQTIELVQQYVDAGLKVIVFSMRTATADRIAEAVDAPQVYSVHGEFSNEQKRDRLQAFATWDEGVIVSARLLDEGIDVPDADIGVNVASTQSRLQLVQRLGRLLRPESDIRPVFHHFVPRFEIRRHRDLAPVEVRIEETVEPEFTPQMPERIGSVELTQPKRALSLSDMWQLLTAADPEEELLGREDIGWWVALSWAEAPDRVQAWLREYITDDETVPSKADDKELFDSSTVD